MAGIFQRIMIKSIPGFKIKLYKNYYLELSGWTSSIRKLEYKIKKTCSWGFLNGKDQYEKGIGINFRRTYFSFCLKGEFPHKTGTKLKYKKHPFLSWWKI